jgi:hypothetical protein
MRPERRRGRKEGGGADEVLLHLVVADLLLAEDRAQRAEAEAWEEGGGADEMLLHLVVADLLLVADRARRAEALLLLAADRAWRAEASAASERGEPRAARWSGGEASGRETGAGGDRSGG